MTDTAAEGVAEVATGHGLDDRAIGELVDRARAEGVSLTGPGGLLAELTKKQPQGAALGQGADPVTRSSAGRLGVGRVSPSRSGGSRLSRVRSV